MTIFLIFILLILVFKFSQMQSSCRSHRCLSQFSTTAEFQSRLGYQNRDRSIYRGSNWRQKMSFSDYDTGDGYDNNWLRVLDDRSTPPKSAATFHHLYWSMGCVHRIDNASSDLRNWKWIIFLCNEIGMNPIAVKPSAGKCCWITFAMCRNELDSIWP